MYPGVNEKLGRSWWDYGENLARHALSPISASLPLVKSLLITSIPDNLVVQWGIQDSYEIVRKVGRGKYSEAGVLSSN